MQFLTLDLLLNTVDVNGNVEVWSGIHDDGVLLYKGNAMQIPEELFKRYGTEMVRYITVDSEERAIVVEIKEGLRG